MKSIRLFLAAIATLALSCGAWAQCAAPLVVNNTADSGCGSLRNAIEVANTTLSLLSDPLLGACPIEVGTPPTITFDTSAGPLLIKPATPLPALTCAEMTLDGGGTPNTVANDGSTNAAIKVEIDGSACINQTTSRAPSFLKTDFPCDGLEVQGYDVTIKGLSIHSFSGNGVVIPSGGSANLYGNFIGTDATGRAASMGNQGYGINVVGGDLYAGGAPSLPGDRNLVTGNLQGGVHVDASGGGLDLFNNLIGGAGDGTGGIGNGGGGVLLANTVFGIDELDNNYIRYNGGPGISVQHRNMIANGNVIYGNSGDAIVFTDITAVPFAPPTIDSFTYDPGSDITTINMSADLGALSGTVDLFSNPGYSFTNLPTYSEGNVYLGSAALSIDPLVSSTRLTGHQQVMGRVRFPTATITEATCSECGAETSAYSFPVLPPLAELAFNPSVIPAGYPSELIIVVANPNDQQMSSVDYMYVLPADIQLGAGSITFGPDCGAGYSPPAIVNGVHVTNLTLAPSGSCTVHIPVTASIAGSHPSGGITVNSSLGEDTSFADGTLVVTQPVLSIVSGSGSFGNVPVNVTASTTITLMSTGTETVNISSMNVNSTPPFGFTSTTCLSGGLAPGSTCTVTLTFSPTSAGVVTGVLQFTSNTTPQVLSIPLSGTGTAPALGVSPPSVSFGNVTVGLAPTMDVTLTNTGNAVMTLAQPAVNNTSGAAFSKTGTTCLTTLAPGASCTVTIGFAPTSATGYAGLLDITANLVGGTTVSVSLSGNGLAPPAAVQLSAASINFGSQNVGTQSAPQTVTLTNTGGSTLSILSMSSSATFPFAGPPIAGDCLGLSSLAAGASCAFRVFFAPTSTGTLNGTLTITDSASGSPHTIGLTGIGVPATAPALSLSASSLAFGTIVTGLTSSPQVVTVTNNGTATLSFTSVTATGDFAASGCTGSIAPSTSCSIAVTFKPTTTGARTGSLTIVSNDAASPAVVALSGTGVAPPIMTLSTSSIAFGNVTSGGSATQSFTIANTGGSPMGISSILPSTATLPPTSSVFTATHNCPASLPNGSSCTVNVVFAPKTIASFTGSVTITAAGVSPATQSVSLSGAGIGGVASVAFSPTSLTFPRQGVGTTSAPQSVVLTNNGTGDLQITSISATGDFGYMGCGFPLTLVAGASCTFSVTFSPLSNGVLPGSIVVVGNAPGSPHQVSLSGTGANGPQPSLTVRPLSLDFGDARIGTQHTDTITITSNGSAPLGIASISTSTGDFVETNACPASLAVGLSCDVTVIFTPTAVGPRTGHVIIASDGDPALFNVGLTGNGVPIPPGVLTVDRFVDFGQHVIATTSRTTLDLRNTGELPLNVTSMDARGAGYTLEGSCGTIAPAGICTVTLVFAPPSIGTFTGALTIVSNDARGPIVVDLLGQGIAVPRPEIELSVDGIGFANQFVTTRSPAQRITIRSVGTAPLHVTGISVTGPFELSGSCPATMASNTNCDVSVTFLPVTAGQSQGRLTVDSDAQAGRGFASLTGTGCRFFSVAGMRSLQRLCQ